MQRDAIQVRRLFPGLTEAASAVCRRIFVLAGGALERAGPEATDAVAPCVVIVPPRYQLRTSTRLAGTVITIDGNTERSLLQQPSMDGLRAGVLSSSVSVIGVDKHRLAELEAIAGEVASELEIRGPAYEAVALAKLTELAAAVIRAAVDAAPGPSETWSMDQVCDYVRRHYDESFALTAVAARCALSTGAFSREFKRFSGSPLFEYINTVRVQKACSLLKHSRKSVTQIAMDVGYNNVSFFNRYFRKTMGMSPTQYRAVARR